MSCIFQFTRAGIHRGSDACDGRDGLGLQKYIDCSERGKATRVAREEREERRRKRTHHDQAHGLYD